MNTRAEIKSLPPRHASTRLGLTGLQTMGSAGATNSERGQQPLHFGL